MQSEIYGFYLTDMEQSAHQFPLLLYIGATSRSDELYKRIAPAFGDKVVLLRSESH